MYQYKALITKVVDGNTVHAEIDLGFRRTQYAALTLYGIRAPTPSPRPDILDAGDLARIYLERLVKGKPAVIQTFKDGSAEIVCDGKLVNALMILEGHATADNGDVICAPASHYG